MSTRMRIIGLLGCSIMVMLALAIGSFDAPTAAVAAEPPDDQKTAEQDDDSDRGHLAGPKGPRRKAPPPKADDEDDEEGDEPRKMRPPRRRGEFGPRGEDRPRGARGDRGRPFDGDGPPHRDRGRGGDFPHPRFELTEEVVREVMLFLGDELPDWHKKLDRLREENPRAFRGALRRVVPLVEEYKHLEGTNPELAKKVLDEFRIEHKLRKLARQYMEAEGDAEAREKLETEIAPLVREQLGIRFLRREAKLDEMQKRIARGREKLERERVNIDKAVAKRMKQIKKGKFRDRDHKKFRRDRKERRGLRDGPRRRGPRGDDGERDRPHRRRPAREPEDEL